MILKARSLINQRRHKVLRLKIGHGDSDRNVEQISAIKRALGDDVIELLDHLGISRVRFCGISTGGLTGMGLAAAPGTRRPPGAGQHRGAHRFGRAWTGAHRRGAVTRWLSPGFFEREPGFAQLDLHRHQSVEAALEQAVGRVLHALQQLPARE